MFTLNPTDIQIVSIVYSLQKVPEMPIAFIENQVKLF